jgi:hypothetical protein
MSPIIGAMGRRPDAAVGAWQFSAVRYADTPF